MKINVGGQTFEITSVNLCPHCHITNIPNSLWTTPALDTDGAHTYLSAWRCSNNECAKIFITQHNRKDNKYVFCRFLNGYPLAPNFPRPILDLKPDNVNQTKFIKTYLQSLQAENNGLDELAGMGYRKAIEYLVKDWAIQNYPDEKEKIENLWLGQVISQYYEGDLKDILERATWLGNDQAHYNKLFKEYDISILKELIELIMVELDRQYKKRHYIELIKSRK